MVDGGADVVVLVNAFLFPDEVDLVLAALPGEWDAIASAAGDGTWCVLRRTQPA